MKKISAVFFAAFAALCAPSPEAAAAAMSMTLVGSIEATLRNNPNIKAFQELRQAAEFDMARSSAGYFPRVDVRGGAGLEQWTDDTTRNPMYVQDKDRFYPRSDVSLVVSQNIWDGLATPKRKRVSEARLSSAEYRLLGGAEALSMDAILAHIEVCRQRKLLELAEANVINHKKILDSQTERQNAGVGSLSDVTQTQSRLARAEATLAETKATLKAAYSNYKRLTGIAASDEGKFEVPPAPPGIFPSLQSALSSSMTVNPKVGSQMADVAAAHAQRDLDKSAFHPSVSLELSENYRWQLESSASDSWGTAAQLRGAWNLSNGGYDINTLRGNRARIRKGNSDLQALRDSLAQETEDAWTQWLNARQLSEFYSNTVLYNTQTRDMYLEQFNVGQRSLMDLLDSENDLYSASVQLTTSQMDNLIAQYRIMTLGGRLFTAVNIDVGVLNVATNQDDGTKRDLAGTT
ncbi:MAG: TolC family outer membrane protein, partial [Deltaproteobacteria bacterium]|nr:TolC family outer membrane protein [Deltaproteobacteria bacterium]